MQTSEKNDVPRIYSDAAARILKAKEVMEILDSESPVQKAEDEGNRIDYVNLDEILIDLKYPRKDDSVVFRKPKPYDLDSMMVAALAKSIRQWGLLHPILVQRDEDGRIHLISGRRRVQAARRAGRSEIPAIFIHPKVKTNSQEVSLVENIHRRNLSTLEVAEALQELRNQGYSYRALSLMTGESNKSIAELLVVNKLPEDVKEQCRIIDFYQAIPRSTLLRIAKMEGRDSDKLQEVMKLHYREHRSRVEVAKDKAQGLKKTLGRMKEDVIKEDDKEELDDELRGLKTSIDKVLS